MAEGSALDNVDTPAAANAIMTSPPPNGHEDYAGGENLMIESVAGVADSSACMAALPTSMPPSHAKAHLPSADAMINQLANDKDRPPQPASGGEPSVKPVVSGNSVAEIDLPMRCSKRLVLKRK